MDGDALERGKACLASVRGSTVSSGRHLTSLELAKLFKVIASSVNPAATRDAALLALLCVGLRRAEVAGLKVTDFESDSGALLVRGKGNKQRKIWLTNGAKLAVEAWIALRGHGRECQSLLLAINKGGKIQDSGITPQSVYTALLKRAEQAGVVCTPHDCRRTFVGNALDAGIDIVTVQHLAGHSSPTTTARYDRRPD